MPWFLSKRSLPVYAILAALWIGVVTWEGVEHVRVRNANRQTLINRGRDITSTLGIVVRSQRRFGGFISQDRFEAALKDLIRPGDLDSVVVLSKDGLPVAAAGDSVEVTTEALSSQGVSWSDHSLTLMNLIDLGSTVDPERDEPTTIIMAPESIPERSFRRRGERGERDGTSSPTQHRTQPSPTEGGDTNTIERWGENRSRSSFGRAPFGRPPWMSEEEFQDVIKKRGVHSFLIVLSNDAMTALNHRDLWMRLAIVLFATTAAVVSALAWHNLTRSSELQLRLVKASEMNTHLRKMNLSAAGLAHETRNPLNLIRGMAQMISRQSGVPDETRNKSLAIVEEADRVTAQLNEFINYSKPRDVVLAPVSFTKIVEDVARALSIDAEEKNIKIVTPSSEHKIEADDQMLRQIVFNLVINAIQAIDGRGEVRVAIVTSENGDSAIEVRDDGPGVPADQRTEIFKPYVTMHQTGTGLGLSVVQQIVSAHGWEIECVPNEPKGACFRIAHVRRLATNETRS